MRPAYARHPYAAVLHALGLGLLMATYSHWQLPLSWSIPAYLLLALWLYATSQGVGSARALAKLCERDDAYRWLCGGVSVNYHTLADFRVAHPWLLDELLIEHVASLAAAGGVVSGEAVVAEHPARARPAASRAGRSNSWRMVVSRLEDGPVNASRRADRTAR